MKKTLITLGFIFLAVLFLTVPDTLELAMPIALSVLAAVLFKNKAIIPSILLGVIAAFFFVTLSGQDTIDLATATGESAQQGNPLAIIFLALITLGIGFVLGKKNK